MTATPPDERTTSLLVPEPRTEIAAVEVAVVDGADAGKRATIPIAGLRIGTAPGAGLQLTDPTVSRIHCELRLRRGAVHLIDGGSTNGCVANGVRVRDADLPTGTLVQLGATTVQLSPCEERLYVPLSPRTQLGRLVGASAEMRRVYAIIERAAPTDAAVLIRGETGTGKELAARAIHELSERAAAPLVPVDCAAISPGLIESELFGHVKGAFSGADRDRKGLFEEADGGTIFLDEIGELPLAMQAKLLRALESREIRRVGGNAIRTVDVRVIAATHRPLAPDVNAGAFREDLFYRLAVIELEMPSLSMRRSDIPLLAQSFYERITGRPEPLPLELLASLSGRSWAGNVRELRNFIERSVSLGLTAADPAPARRIPDIPNLDRLIPDAMPMLEARQAWVDQFDAAYIRGLLARTGANVTRAAREAQVSRRFLQNAMRRLGLRDDAGDDDGAD